ncbi:MAG: hypothetical protein NTW64_01795 [Candidatus Omnitrophica bacterium]|nr:hypothetical protein [Candidatus Omnitrophota bacterium]
MLLKELLGEKILRKKFNFSDIARVLGISRQATFFTLNSDILNCKAGTIKKYMESVDLKCDFKRLISKN